MLSSQRVVFVACLFLLTALTVPRMGLGFVGPEHQNDDVNHMDQMQNFKSDAESDILFELQTAPGWLAWTRDHPGWRVRWNTLTRTPHRAHGPAVRIDGFGPLTDDNIELASRDFLARTQSWSGIETTELQLVHARKRLNRWYVTFRQTVHGIPVRGGRADLRLGANGEVLLLGSDWYPDVVAATKPRISVQQALRAALEGLPSSTTETESGLLIVPLKQTEGFVYRLAHELRFRTHEPPGNWYCLVDALQGDLLLRENQVRFVTIDGRVTAEVEPRTPGDIPMQWPLRETRLEIGDGALEFGHTDPDGNYAIETSAADSVLLSVGLEGMFARILNASLNRETPRVETRLLPPTTQDFHWDDSNSRASERDAYYHTLLAHNWINELDPSFTGVDYMMPVTVDITSRDCNAYYDGFGINFLEASERCANTARIADVVYHEYGHGITDWQYQPFSASGAMHEAFSDYLAATMTDQPEIGLGFFGPGTRIRTVDNTRRSPDDVSGEVHNDGLILAGALWDLREALGAAMADTLWHFARYGLADNFDDYMLDVLATDDDNANIYDGTPHFDAIVEAFMSHGIGDYSVQITHQPEPDTEDLSKPLVIEATILSIFPLEPTSPLLRYRIDSGDWQTMNMSATGVVRTFSATLPQQPSGTMVDYYLTAADTQGHETTLPASAPAIPFSFHVGVDTTPPVVSFQPLSNRPMDSPGWPLRALVTDNLDLGVAHVRVEFSRNSIGLGQSVDLAAVGEDGWLGTLPIDGAVLGDVIHYRLVATDASSTPNVTTEPPAGTYSFKVVQGYLRDLEADDGGMSATGEWQWGVPSTGPSAAFSGSNVWATNLGGTYSNNTTSILQLPSMDLGTWERASLVFRQWGSVEEFYDGGRVEISSDGGLSWSAVEPNRGYPWRFVEVFLGPGYSGNSDGWRTAEFDLSRYLGQVVDLRLHFASDAGVVDAGWYVDDIEFVERQVLSIPLRLSAVSGQDSKVVLYWLAPAGIDPLQVGSPWTGYNVYRSTNSDMADAIQLNDVPLTTPSFLDTDVVNGTWYYYAVTALYEEGESEFSQLDAALPFRATFAADTDDLVVVSESAAVDTSITLSNPGTGFLEVDVWLGAPADSIDDVRIVWFPKDKDEGGDISADTAGRPWSGQEANDLMQPSRMEVLSGFNARAMAWPKKGRAYEPATPSANYIVIHTDPSEPGSTPDLKEVQVKAETGSLFFKVTGYEAWGNILTDFTLVLSIDADAHLGTGDDQGADFYVLAGAFPMQQFGAPALIATYERRVVGIPPHMVLLPEADFMEIGFPAPFVGAPEKLFVSVMALALDFETPIDMAPDPSPTWAWLTPATRHLMVTAGEPTPLGLMFADGLPSATYQGQLFMETNAPDTPLVTIPVRYLFGVTPVELFDLTAVQERSDVVLCWRTALEQDLTGFRIYRARENGSFTALQPEVPLSHQKSYVFRDPSPDPGTYTYRVAEVSPDGSVTLHAGIDIDVESAAPLRTFLDPNVPNPFNPRTTFEFGVAEAGHVSLSVFDARGRLVKTLIQESHLSPGFYRQLWDGTNDHGVRVSSGIYHARLKVNGEVFGRRLTLLK